MKRLNSGLVYYKLVNCIESCVTTEQIEICEVVINRLKGKNYGFIDRLIEIAQLQRVLIINVYSETN